MSRLAVTVALCLALTACAVGNTFDYRNAVPALSAATDKPVAVRAVDQRPYVLAGDNTPQWVGMFRGGFGNPFGVHTTSGAPLADDVAAAVTASLTTRGVKAVLATAAAPADGRTLTVTIRDWRSDTMFNTLIRYDLRAEVSGPDGKVLASNVKAGEKTFSSINNLPSTTGAEVLVNFRTIMTELLDTPEIRAALL